MARRNSDFGIDDAEIAKIARELGGTPGAVKRALAAVVNEALDETQHAAIKRITTKVNLSPDYILKHLKVTQRASASTDTGILSATKRGILLSRFDARQEYRASRDKRKRSGNRVRAGVSVRVDPTRRITMASAFLVKLRSGNGQGVAVRNSAQDKMSKKVWPKTSLDYSVLHGPSVDQLFQAALNDNEAGPDLDELATRFLRRLAGV